MKKKEHRPYKKRVCPSCKKKKNKLHKCSGKSRAQKNNEKKMGLR